MTLSREHRHLLLVDDEEDIREVLTIALVDLGYTVTTADNGQTALSLYREQYPAIILTDIKMPGMDGIELLKAVKRENPDAEVVMITGHGDMDLAIESLKHEAADFITKPINVDALKIALDRVHERILTRRKLAQYTENLEALVKKKIELQDHLASLGLMVGSISHGVKGLLTNLDAGIFMLQSGLSKDKPERSRDGLDIVKSTTERIKKLMMDILFYVKDRELQPDAVDIPLFADDVADGMEAKTVAHGIQLVREFGRAPAMWTLDPDFMRTALINLLDNAVDACVSDTSKGSHRIVFRMEQEGDRLVVTIEDDGIGMDCETKEKIFDLFFSTKGSRGTGFGLFISRNIILQHDGEVTVHSTKGRGSKFSIRIPAPQPV